MAAVKRIRKRRFFPSEKTKMRRVLAIGERQLEQPYKVRQWFEELVGSINIISEIMAKQDVTIDRDYLMRVHRETQAQEEPLPLSLP